MIRRLPILLLLVFGPAILPLRAALGRGASNVLSRERRVSGGRVFSRDDPVPALADGDIDLFKGGISQPEITKLLDGYLDRMLAFYAEKHRFPETLVSFLGNKRNKVAKEVFVSALDPRYDDIGGAARVFEELRALDEKKLVKYVHLATALAVVYDTPGAIETSRSLWLGAVRLPGGSLHGPRETWDYYTNPKLKHRFGFALDRLPWCILVHLVDNDTSESERRWALTRYSMKAEMEEVYHSVPYDYAFLKTLKRKIEEHPYTLANILKHGGVCADRAHFSSRIAKCLGIPAMKIECANRWGGLIGRHACTGYLVIREGRPILEFTGRYFYDYYYTGNIFDPQTRTATLDRYVAMMYDGASLSYPKYNKSQMLVRIAEKIRAEHAAESLELTQKALALNYFNMWGWPLLMEHIKDGTLAKKDGLSWFNKMTRALAGHPDMTFACLNTFIGCVPAANARGRQSLYNQAASLYASRPDLLLKLRVTQAKELVSAGEKAKAVNLLVSTIVRHAKEAKLVLPAMRMAVELAKELGLARRVHAKLRVADRTFPKNRAGTPSVAYEEFRKLLDQLK